MTKPLRLLFVIADGAHARLVRRAEDAGAFVTVLTLKAHAHSGGHGRVAEGHDDAAFARTVADAVNVETQTGRVDRLALVAPAHTLVAIQRGLTVLARGKVFRTLAKDLAKTPDHSLGDWLRPLELG